MLPRDKTRVLGHPHHNANSIHKELASRHTSFKLIADSFASDGQMTNT